MYIVKVLKHQLGVTLLELIAALAVMGIIARQGVRGYYYIFERHYSRLAFKRLEFILMSARLAAITGGKTLLLTANDASSKAGVASIASSKDSAAIVANLVKINFNKDLKLVVKESLEVVRYYPGLKGGTLTFSGSLGAVLALDFKPDGSLGHQGHFSYIPSFHARQSKNSAASQPKELWRMTILLSGHHYLN